jgi:hypothetical protein
MSLRRHRSRGVAAPITSGIKPSQWPSATTVGEQLPATLDCADRPERLPDMLRHRIIRQYCRILTRSIDAESRQPAGQADHTDSGTADTRSHAFVDRRLSRAHRIVHSPQTTPKSHLPVGNSELPEFAQWHGSRSLDFHTPAHENN